jgi:hypothetical protein
MPWWRARGRCVVCGDVGETLAGVLTPEFVGEYCECVDLRYAWCW